jgi:hypothetical protein
MLTIDKKLQEILENYQSGKLSKAEAKRKMRPLIKESVKITTDPEYLIEEQLDMYLYVPSAQEY